MDQLIEPCEACGHPKDAHAGGTDYKPCEATILVAASSSFDAFSMACRCLHWRPLPETATEAE